MKRAAIFGAVMFALGLAMAPRPTVAGKDESLALLCQRFKMTAGHLRDRAAVVAAGRRTDDKWLMRDLAIRDTLTAVEIMVCPAVTSGPQQ